MNLVWDDVTPTLSDSVVGGGPLHPSSFWSRKHNETPRAVHQDYGSWCLVVSDSTDAAGDYLLKGIVRPDLQVGDDPYRTCLDRPNDTREKISVPVGTLPTFLESVH